MGGKPSVSNFPAANLSPGKVPANVVFHEYRFLQPRYQASPCISRPIGICHHNIIMSPSTSKSGIMRKNTKIHYCAV